MLDAGIGLLRTLPAPEPEAVATLRRTAGELGIDWPATTTVAELLTGLPVDTPAALTLRRAATSLLRGAGYAAFDSAAGTPRPTTRGTVGSAPPTRTSRPRCDVSSTASVSKPRSHWRAPVVAVNGWLKSALHPALIHAGNGPDDAVPRVTCRFVGRMQLNL